MIQTEIHLAYENAFAEDIQNKDTALKACLEKLNRDEAITRCCKINFALFKDLNGVHKGLIKENFSPSSVQRIEWFVYKQKKKGSASDFPGFSRGSMLAMIYYIIQYCPTSEALGSEDTKFNENFSRSALLVLECKTSKYKLERNENLFSNCKKALPVIKDALEQSNHIS
tara:strand:- start:9854 stop:10363 length:510 start_codon:yes stop_codon:yes gene_type:complete